jgi:pimeloyl-ACP methyl ester carboxylesterase
VIEYLVDYARVLAGGARPFDEAAIQELVRRDVERAHNIAASENHGLAAEGEVSRQSLSSIAVPTLVIHGTEDPMFPLEHGEALAREIAGARLLMLEETDTEWSEPTGRPSPAPSPRTLSRRSWLAAGRRECP